MATFQAAGTSYATHGHAMIPFYIFYSMFGFQRTGDQDVGLRRRPRPRLPHRCDGRPDHARRRGPPARRRPQPHPRSTVPFVRGYDPAFAYELAAIIRDGIERMHVKGEDLFYYITCTTRTTPEAEARRRRRGILRGIYRFAEAPQVGKDAHPARLVGSGSILERGPRRARPASRAVRCRGRGLQRPVLPDARRDALEAERWNRLHPDAQTPRMPYVTTVLSGDGGPIVAATDWMKALPDMVARWLPDHYLSWAPTGSAGAGPARTCGRCSRSIRRISPPRRSSRWPAAARWPRAKAAKASRPRRRPDKIDVGFEALASAAVLASAASAPRAQPRMTPPSQTSAGGGTDGHAPGRWSSTSDRQGEYPSAWSTSRTAA